MLKRFHSTCETTVPPLSVALQEARHHADRSRSAEVVGVDVADDAEPRATVGQTA